ncbi:acyl-CoA thioesterase [Roseovarius autotrophicus]|uniref:acyl-CoA thioesterase n=1 Tax=Roseovarius autotrophicus TaxID=2824121 RepID=UPI0019DDA7F2|nr:acyl-CoA thioesterase [Roseovarius autotrophicus]MBE0454343.1 thioesterase family protein [Roseovarius sp.]
MYPFARMIWQLYLHRRSPPLPVTGTHVSYHYCLPWDIDLWRELNNGRTLTLYDLGRIPLAGRVGLIGVLRRKGWGLTMAGASVRYRRRVRAFERVEMRSRLIGWDARFMYLEQSMWNRTGECTSHILYRGAVTGRSGIVPPEEVLAALGETQAAPALPDWARAWIAADDTRPWPPMQE